MAMLAFFPWLSLREAARCSEFELLPITVGARNSSLSTDEQNDIESVLAAYRDQSSAITSAVVMKLTDKHILSDLSEEERTDAFTFSELVSFAGLSAREYFESIGSYCNHTHFQFYIQRFANASGGIATQTRRRDGRNVNYSSGGTFQAYRPAHAQFQMILNVDESLLEALISSRELPKWQSLYDGIQSFNRSNTDSDQITVQQEIVSMMGAFETALDLGNGNERDLVSAFLPRFTPDSLLGPTDRSSMSDVHKQRFSTCISLRESWIRDFFILRSNLAHGRRTSRYNSAWSVSEHLVLGAFAFPLLVKQILSSAGTYQLTRQDRYDINVFEQLAAAQLFERLPDQRNSGDSPWQRIRGNIPWDIE